MRSFACLILFAFALTAAAEQRPLSVKEVSLMLRAGYSSESILRDLAQRRLLDVPDEAAKKSLGEFGASPQLMQALESNQYRVDPAAAEQAVQQERSASARQAADSAQTYRDATAALHEQRARAAAAQAIRTALGPSLAAVLQDKLVRCQDGAISSADASVLASKKLIAFYFSAHWCPPCRKFTPELVDYYTRVAAAHPEFELIFVSYDKSRFNWETYMRDTKMPWLAIDFDKLADFPQLKQLGGESIPSLLVLNEKSQIVASSYDGEKYVGPQNALVSLDQIFAGNAATTTAVAP